MHAAVHSPGGADKEITREGYCILEEIAYRERDRVGHTPFYRTKSVKCTRSALRPSVPCKSIRGLAHNTGCWHVVVDVDTCSRLLGVVCSETTRGRDEETLQRKGPDTLPYSFNRRGRALRGVVGYGTHDVTAYMVRGQSALGEAIMWRCG